MRYLIASLSAVLLTVVETFGITIKGKVIDAHSGEPISFASVAVVGTETASMTDDDGLFEIEISQPDNFVIRASMVGYNPAEQTVNIGRVKNGGIIIAMRQSNVEMDELVVSANRNVVRRCEAPVVVGVISTKLFNMVNSADLAQSLDYQTGLRVENNCQNCGFPQLRINGLEGPYTQVLINNRPVVSSLSGVYALEQMPANMIERIEVVRGGGSALFGANAVGGTVNVITKEPVNDRIEAGYNMSNFNGKTWDKNVTANATVVDDDGHYGISLFESYRHRSPYDHDGDGFSEIGKLSLNTLGFNAFYRLHQTARIGVEYHNTHEFRRGGNKFDLEPFQTDITEQTHHYINSGGLNYNQSWHNYKYRLNSYASAQHIDRNSYYGAQRNPDAYGKTNDMTWIIGSTFSGDIDRFIFSPATMTAGVEYQSNNLHDIMTGYGRNMRQNVDIFGTFVQSEWKMRHFTFLAGGRLDFHNLVDNPIFSPRLNVLYRPTPHWQIRGTWSTGFRAPQAYDEDLHVTAVGGEGVIIRLADGLNPERSNSFSFSVDRDFRIGELDTDILLEGFYTDLSDVFVLDVIGRDDNGNMVKERRNGDGARVYGLNTDIKLTYTDYTLDMGFTAQRSRYKIPEKWSEGPDVAPTRDMPRAPEIYGFFTLSAVPRPRLECSLSGVFTGHMHVPHYAPDPTIIPADYPYHYISSDIMEQSPAFFDLNAKVSYTFPLHGKLRMELSAGVKNILGQFQKDLDKGEFRDSGYFYGPAQPRTFFFGIKFMTI